jgi:hypothetical protein
MVRFFAALRKAGYLILYMAPPPASAERLCATFRNGEFSGSAAFAV